MLQSVLNLKGGSSMKKPKETMGRREFFRNLSIRATAVGAGAILLQAEEVVQAAAPQEKWGMLIDIDCRTGCHACTIACISENNIPDGYYRSGVKITTNGHYPNVSTEFLPRLCKQCEDAPCLNLCPTGATYRTHEDTVVHVNRGICVGCRNVALQAACLPWRTPSVLEPECIIRMGEKASTPFYRHLASLLRSFLQDEKSCWLSPEMADGPVWTSSGGTHGSYGSVINT
jgi:NAD-dependent dihydropyrimidine dehydrogenase PreA subunit